MALPAWAILLLVGIPLAQIPLVLYLSRWFELDGDAPLATPTRAHWTERAGESHVPTDPAGLCRRCGTTNDPVFTYCRRCVAPLVSGP